MQLNDLIERIKQLEKIDHHSVEMAICKLFEECGELAQAFNKSWKTDNIHEKICEESSDILICLLLIISKYSLNIEDVLTKAESQLDKWQATIKIKQQTYK